MAIVPCLAIRHCHVSIVREKALFSHPNSHQIRLGKADPLPSSRPGMFFLLHPRTTAVICVPGLTCNGASNLFGKILLLWSCPNSSSCKNEDGQQRVHGTRTMGHPVKGAVPVLLKSPQFLIELYSYNLPRFNGNPCLELHKQEQP